MSEKNVEYYLEQGLIGKKFINLTVGIIRTYQIDGIISYYGEIKLSVHYIDKYSGRAFLDLKNCFSDEEIRNNEDEKVKRSKLEKEAIAYFRDFD